MKEDARQMAKNVLPKGEILPLTVPSFRRYGCIIEYPQKEKKGTVRNLWRIVHTESAKVGWRIAYLVLRDKSVGRLECHPFSDESFEPVRGSALLFVAQERNPAVVQCFALDRAVILKKGIWHGVVTVTPETEIKITENARVVCRYWPLGYRLRHPRDLLEA